MTPKLAGAAVVLALTLAACNRSPPAAAAANRDPAADTAAIVALAHKVAEIEITLAKLSLASPSQGSHPEADVISQMEKVSADKVNWRALPPDEQALLRDVALRINAAEQGYSELFMKAGCAFTLYDITLPIKGAYESAKNTPSEPGSLMQPDLPAALALEEIYHSPTIQSLAETRGNGCQIPG